MKPVIPNAHCALFSPNLLTIVKASLSAPPETFNTSPNIAPRPTTTAIKPNVPPIPSSTVSTILFKFIPEASPIRILEIKSATNACIFETITK